MSILWIVILDGLFFAVWIAAHKGKFEVVQCLIANGASLSLSNGAGRSLLSKAIVAHAKNLEIVKILVEKGANMIALIGDWYSPMHKAVKSNNVKTIHYFLQNGADSVDVKNIGVDSSLEMALKIKKLKQSKCFFNINWMNVEYLKHEMNTRLNPRSSAHP